jgi:hypothetical protein
VAGVGWGCYQVELLGPFTCLTIVYQSFFDN